MWFVTPVFTPRYLEHINFVEWWKGDYETELNELQKTIARKLKRHGFKEIVSSFGVIGASKTIRDSKELGKWREILSIIIYRELIRVNGGL
jgi:hypothetical protein